MTIQKCPHCGSCLTYLFENVKHEWWILDNFGLLPDKNYICMKCKGTFEGGLNVNSMP